VPFFDLFLPVSEFAASTLLKLSVDRERIRVVSVFNRVDEMGATIPDPGRVDALRKESHRKVLSVARVTAQKGQRHILEVARCYKEQYGNGIRFYFVGRFEPDGYYAELKELVQKLDLADVVEFVGSVDRPQLRAYYEAADVFLCLSDSESFCVPVIEAQYFKVPVITHACMAIPETLGDGGVLMPELDYTAIATTVSRVIEDTGLRGDLVRRGLENVQRFSRERTAKSFLAALDSGLRLEPTNKTIRHHLLSLAGKIVHTARRCFLMISDQYRYQAVWHVALQRLAHLQFG
jgi:glycosyltransferase involved in cell wall biosynthesis